MKVDLCQQIIRWRAIRTSLQGTPLDYILHREDVIG